MNSLNYREYEEFQGIFENATEGIFRSTLDGRFLIVNPAMAHIFGYESPEEMINSVTDIEMQIHVENETRKQFIEELTKHEKIEGFEARNYRKDKSIIWTRTNVRAIRDEEGNILYFEGFLTDITAQKWAEKRLRQSEEQFRTLAEDAPIGIFLTDAKGQEIYANPHWRNLTGLSLEENLGYEWMDCIHNDDKKRVHDIWVSASERGRPCEIDYRITQKDGSIRWVHALATPILGTNGLITGYVGTAEDITEKKKFNDDLLEEEEKYRQLFEAESDAIFLIDNESGNILEANAATTVLYGYSKEELLSRKSSDLSADPGEMRKATKRTKTNPNQVISIPLQYHKKKDGTIFPVEITGRFFNWRGKSVYIAAIRDITDRRRIEEALSRSEQNFRNIVEHTTNIYYSHTADHLLTFMSPQTREILGYEPEEALKNWHEFLTDNPVNKEGAKLTQNAINTGKRQKPYILELKRRDNQTVWVEVNESPIVENGKTIAIVGSLTDITERKSAEDTLSHQLKELSILHNIALAASSSQSLDELIQRATDTIFDVLQPANCGVELLTATGEMYQAHSSYRGASKNESRNPIPLSQGVIGKVINTGIPLRIGDVSQEEAYIEATKGVRSELCVPIKIHERVIGAFNVESSRPDAFSDADELMLITVAGTMATALERLRLFEKSQHRLQELTVINAVSLVCTNATNVDELIENVTQIIGDSLYPDNFGVLLLNNERNALYPHSSYRGITSGKYPSSLPLEQGIAGQVAATGKALRIANVRNHQKYIEVTSQVRSELCVPIAHGDWIYGVINAESLKIDAFSLDDEQLLSTIASTLAVAIEKLHLIESEQQSLQEAETLREATTALTTSLDLRSVLDTILDSLAKVVHYDSASVILAHEEGMEIFAARNLPDDFEYSGKRFRKKNKWKHFHSTHKPLIISDVKASKDFERWSDKVVIRGWMGVPLVIRDRVIGYLSLDSHQIDAYSKADAELVQTFANHAAIVIENARLFEAEQQARKRAEALREATAALTTSLELESLYDTILKSLTKLLPHDSASIALFEQGKLRLVAGQGLRENKIFIGQDYLFDPEKWGKAEEFRRTIIIPDVHEDERFIKLVGSDYIRGWMGVPMVAQDRLVGILNLDSTIENHFTEEHASLAQTFGNQAAIAIENARLFEAEQQRHRESETLRQAALAITTSLDLKSVLDTLLIVMKQVIPYTSASVLLQEGEDLRLAATQGFSKPESLVNLTFPASDELFQKLVETQQPLIIEDVQTDHRFNEWGESQNVRAWIGVPLIDRGEVIGCITIDSDQPKAYEARSANLAITFAYQASTAIRNARQFETELRHLEEADTLRQTAEAITSSLDIQLVLDAILNNLSRVVPFDSAALFLKERDSVRFTAGKGFRNDEEFVGLLFPASNALLQEVWDTGKPLILEDATADPRFEKWVDTHQTRGWMGVPLVARGAMIGCITIDSYKPGAYKEHDANLAVTFAHQAAVAIENARLYDRSEQQIRQLTVLRDIDSAISSSFDLHVTLDFIASHAVNELRADASAILLYNPDLEALSLYTETGFPNEHSSYASYVRVGEGLGGQVALNRKLVQIPDLSSLPEENARTLVEKGFKSYFGIPLIGKGLVKGVLEIYSRSEINPTSEWLNFLQTLAGQAAIAIDNVELFKNLHRSNLELTLAYDTTLAGWGRALEMRDKETQGHTNRVVKLTVELARRMGITGEELTNVMRGTLLHDIGKMGIPDDILNKPGTLTEEEWAIMRQHPKYAYDLINPIPYLRSAVEIPYGHHERWDGSGYPLGLKGEEIPLAARIFAIVDIYDALLNERVYREAWPEEKVIEYLKNAAGIELDPAIVEKFLEMIQEDHYKNQAE